MSAHSEIEAHLARKGKTFDGSVAGITTLAAANNTFSFQELNDLKAVSRAEGHEVSISAGVLKIRPKDSTL